MTSQLTNAMLASNTSLTFNDVFSYPEYTLRGVESWREIARLGSNNIAVLISQARRHEKELTGSIAELKERQNLLRGKSGNDFAKLARQYKDPVFPKISVPSDSWSKDAEPLDAASKDRKRGETTFNRCGWCKWASGSTCRYSYNITSSCSLLGGNEDLGGENKFDTHCLMTGLTAQQVATQVVRFEKQVKDLLWKRDKVRHGIKLLQMMKKVEPVKPYLMSLRPHDHFNVGDDAMAYIGQWPKDNEHTLVAHGKWAPVTIVFGYRHHDGCISALGEFPIHSNTSYDGGRGYGAGMSRPEILLRSEFEWLRNAILDRKKGDLGFLGMWTANIDPKLEGFSRVQFVKDLANGDIALPPADWKPSTDEIPVKSKKDAERVLHMLDADLFKTEDEIRSWANMQLHELRPDRLNGKGENVKAYGARTTRAVCAARDLLIDRLRSSQK
ncbi:hypothetical protein HY091_00960 [Candidatus Kaiserbacteria bacterium]|nr:hypothetical protein [Candidatus Kaiserbacteria bacterium]